MNTPSFQPLYGQVKELMIKRLIDKEWPPGMLLPSENQLAKELKVSQGTVRKALDEMAAEKLVVRRQGRGTFVAEHDQQRALFHFFNLVDKKNGDRQLPKSEVLLLDVSECNELESEQLELKKETKVIRINRVRWLDERPVIYEMIVVPHHLFPYLAEGGKLPPNTLYPLYESSYGISVARATEWLSAELASDEVAKHLHIMQGNPILAIQRIAYTLNKRPVELRLSRCSTEHHQYLSELF